MQLSIHNLPFSERPREKLMKKGSEALSLAELLAVILGTGTKNKSVITLSYEVLAHFGSLEEIANASVYQLMEIKGLGQVKAVQLKAALSLGLRLRDETANPDYQIQSARDVYHYLAPQMEKLSHESFALICMNAKGYVLKYELINTGTKTSCIVDVQRLLKIAIQNNAVSIVIVHNHPSGDPTPSKDDIQMTTAIKQASELIGIQLKDHVIIGRGCCDSVFRYI